MKDKSIGFILLMVTAVLAIAAGIVYPFVMYVQPLTYIPMVLALLLVVILFLFGKDAKFKLLVEAAPILASICMGLAAALAVGKMVNEIGYVISGLDPVSSIATFIAFEALALVGMILSIVSGFLKQTK